jgi:hypothetical protein
MQVRPCCKGATPMSSTSAASVLKAFAALQNAERFNSTLIGTLTQVRFMSLEVSEHIVVLALPLLVFPLAFVVLSLAFTLAFVLLSLALVRLLALLAFSSVISPPTEISSGAKG